MALSDIKPNTTVYGIETVPTAASANNENVRDWLFRLQQSNTGQTTYIIAPTEAVTQPIIRVIDENRLLRDVAKNLWQAYKYHQEYQSFLLGGCTEAEFLAVAEQYATLFRYMSPETLIWASSFLLNTLNENLTSSDLSVLLNVDPAEIENSLASSTGIHAVPLNDQEAHGE